MLDQANYAHLGLPNDPVNAHKLFWKSMKPCLDVEVSIPKCAIIGRKLDVKLRIDHNLKQLPAEKLPQVILEAVRIELVSETRLRIPNGPRRDPQTKWTKLISYYILNATRIPVEKRSRKLTKSKANGWYATVLVPELKNDLRVTPSFATPSLSHSYYLRVRGRWKCDNEEIRVDVEKPLIVLSAYGMEDALLSKGQSTSQFDSGHGEDEASAPPPYTEACGGEIALPSYVNAMEEKS